MKHIIVFFTAPLLLMFIPMAQSSSKEVCPLTSLTDLAIIAWPLLDSNGDHGISYEEIINNLSPELIRVDTAMSFSKADTNYNGLIDPPEVRGILGIIEPMALYYSLNDLDANSDGVIQYSEIAYFIPQSFFNVLDKNGNNVLDCDDMPVWPPEGWTPPPPDPCMISLHMDDAYDLLLPYIDQDNSGGISLNEARAAIPGFDLLINQEVITWEEVWADISQNTYNEIFRNESIELYQVLGGPLNLVAIFDENQDALLNWEEMNIWLDIENFNMFDGNDNDYIDCEEFEALLIYIIQRNQGNVQDFAIKHFRYPHIVEEGDSIRLSVVVEGIVGTPVYTWRHNGEVIHWADGAELFILSAMYEHAGSYSCEISDNHPNPVQTDIVHVHVVEHLAASHSIGLLLLALALISSVFYKVSIRSHYG